MGFVGYLIDNDYIFIFYYILYNYISIINQDINIK
jgi:hypothetical protein